MVSLRPSRVPQRQPLVRPERQIDAADRGVRRAGHQHVAARVVVHPRLRGPVAVGPDPRVVVARERGARERALADVVVAERGAAGAAAVPGADEAAGHREADRAERVAVDHVLVAAADVVHRPGRLGQGLHGHLAGAAGLRERLCRAVRAGLGEEHHAVAGHVDVPATDGCCGGSGGVAVQSRTRGGQIGGAAAYEIRVGAFRAYGGLGFWIGDRDRESCRSGRNPGAREGGAEPGGQTLLDHRRGRLGAQPHGDLVVVELEIPAHGGEHAGRDVEMW